MEEKEGLVQITTTVPISLKRLINKKGFKYNELIKIGFIEKSANENLTPESISSFIKDLQARLTKLEQNCGKIEERCGKKC